MKILLTYSFLIFQVACFAQIVLPGYKNGNWWILRSDTTILLPAEINSVGSFDRYGYAAFENEFETGIIDSNGRIICADEYTTFLSVGAGMFIVSDEKGKSLIDYEKKDTLLSGMNSCTKWTDYHFSYSLGVDTFMYHYPTRNQWKIEDRGKYRWHNYSKAILQFKDFDNRVLYTPNGEKVLLDSTDQANESFATFKIENKQFFNSNRLFIQIPLASANIMVHEGYISYFDGKLAHLRNIEEDEEILALPYDKIAFADEKGCFVYKKEKVGLIDRKNQVRIPVLYDQIYFTDEAIYVVKEGLTGLMDLNYTLRIPCQFNYVYNDSNYYYTSNDFGMQGLYSRAYKKILETQYPQIVVKDKLIKAYKNDKLRILKIDENFNIVSDVVLENAITAKQFVATDNFTYDRRLIPLGWFYERKAITDSIGIVRRYGYTWGLKKPNDSILVRPKFYDPLFAKEASFSVVNGGLTKFNLLGLNFKLGKSFRTVDFSTGKFADNNAYIHFNTGDGETRDYFRCATTLGPLIYRKGGPIETVDYLSKTWNKLVPYAKGGKAIITENAPDVIPFYQWIPFNSWAMNLYDEDLYSPYWDKGIDFENATWNYMDTNGSDRFTESFSFAQDFFKNTAIVKRKTGWGVINQDNLVIPCEFSSVKRVSMHRDTIFIVQKSSSRSIFLDSTLSNTAEGYNNVVKSKDNLALISRGRQNALFFSGESVEADLGNARLLNNNFWVLREKKENILLNEEGNEILRSEYKPKEVLAEDAILVEYKGKQAVVNSFGEEIVPFDRIAVTRFGHFFQIETRTAILLYSKEFKFIRKQQKKERILPNDMDDTYAVIKKNSVKIYQGTDKPIAKLKQEKVDEIERFHYSYFIAKDFLWYDSMRVDIEKGQKLEIHDDGMVQISGKEHNYFYRESLNKPTIIVPVRRVRYLGNDAITYRSDTTTVLQRFDKASHFSLNAGALGDYSDGICLFQVGSKYVYFNEECEPILKKRFTEAASFNKGFAPVKIGRGWTLVSKTGKILSYPSYSKIHPITNNLIETRALPKFGLYDSDGKEIIPPIYEKITFITSDIIQVILDGNMGYFNMKGEELFPIL